MGPCFGGKREDKEQGKSPCCSDVCSETLGDRQLPASTTYDPSVLVSFLIKKGWPFAILDPTFRPSTLEFEIHSSAKTPSFVPAPIRSRQIGQRYDAHPSPHDHSTRLATSVTRSVDGDHEAEWC